MRIARWLYAGRADPTWPFGGRNACSFKRKFIWRPHHRSSIYTWIRFRASMVLIAISALICGCVTDSAEAPRTDPAAPNVDVARLRAIVQAERARAGVRGS